jgi:hypothetical protein
MMFIFVRHALDFCAVALLLALCADLLFWSTLAIGAHVSGSGFGFGQSEADGSASLRFGGSFRF